MKIESIQLKHTLHFTDLQAEFNCHEQPVALILGDQSSGKTSILRFTYQALTWFAARYKDLRTAGVVMLDQDIMLNRLQAKIDVQISYPAEMGKLSSSHDLPLNGPESQQAASDTDHFHCSWQLYKTLNSQGMGISKAETPQLEELAARYQRALKDDPLLGLPLIAYYPAERFVNEVNLLNKNNPAIFQPAHAYEISAIPFTTFSRFFEWFREICDIENAQSAQMVQDILHKSKSGAAAEIKSDSFFASRITQALAEMHAPALQSLRRALAIVLPEFSNIYLQYHPKLQLMVTYQGQTMLFQQLSNSIRNLTALVGDIVRRMCLLNPQLGNSVLRDTPGVVLIDELDMHLHPAWQRRLPGVLKQAFPQVQFIAASHSPQIIGELPLEEIWLMRDNQVIGHPEHALGLSSSEVLEELMDSKARNPAIHQQLQAIERLIEDDQLEMAQNRLTQLETQIGQIPDVVRARSAITALSWQVDDIE